MGRSTNLSAREQGKILAYNEQGLSKRDMARRLRRSVTAVTTFLNGTEMYGKRYKGRKSVMDSRAKRRLRNLASNRQISIRNLKKQLNTSASLTTIRRELSNLKCKHTRMKARPKLTPIHRSNRLLFCRTNMSLNWSAVWFSDEKKWNLDGPDGYNFYWHDLRKEKRIFSRNINSRNGVMVWGCISRNGKSTLGIFNGSVDSAAYQMMLTSNLLPIIQTNDVFQQDNAPPHSSQATKQWLLDNRINVLGWPSMSPDLNIIENVWGMLARRVYADAKQYNSKDELIVAIQREWNRLKQDTIAGLIDGMQGRIFKCIMRQGRSVD